MRRFIAAALAGTAIMIGGCGGESTEANQVSVHSLGPVLEAVVRDAGGQVGVQTSLSKNIYTFASPIQWPVKVSADGVNSYVDVDFDGVKSASDLVFDRTMYSASSTVTELTTVLLEASDLDAQSLDYNLTKYESALSDMQTRFALSGSQITGRTPINAASIGVSVLSDALVQARLFDELNASDLSGLEAAYTQIRNFHTAHLATMSVASAAKYHASYLALTLLDAKKFDRALPNTMPSVAAYLNGHYAESVSTLSDDSMLSGVYNDDYNLAYWELELDTENSVAYVAAGNDGIDTVDITTPSARLDNQEEGIDGFGTTVEYVDKSDHRCLFLADQSNQLQIYGVWPLSHIADPNAMQPVGSFATSTAGASTFDVEHMVTNAGNFELLLVANGAAGLQVVDFRDVDCYANAADLNDSHLLYAGSIGSDAHAVMAASNRKIVYLADGVNGLMAIDVSSGTPAIVNTVTLRNATAAYDLHMVPNSNELYVSTDAGVEIYNTDDSGNILYRGGYLTEGSRANTLGETIRVDKSANNRALFVADVTGGVKVLDITDSTDPELCGVAYFSAANVAERTAVRDVKLQERSSGEILLYVANDSNGLIRIDDARDLLFEHCEGLLD